MTKFKCLYSAKGCTRCELIISAKLKPTLGLGYSANSSSDIMFIGEAPGYTEMKTSVPFSGDSGRLLRHYIKESRLDDVSYITNVVKCRPPENRVPLAREIHACGVHLANELRTFKPKIIVLLGRTAIDRFRPYSKDLINTVQMDEDGIFLYTYHPSYILRNDNTEIYDKTFMILRLLYQQINKYYIANL